MKPGKKVEVKILQEINVSNLRFSAAREAGFGFRPVGGITVEKTEGATLYFLVMERDLPEAPEGTPI